MYAFILISFSFIKIFCLKQATTSPNMGDGPTFMDNQRETLGNSLDYIHVYGIELNIEQLLSFSSKQNLCLKKILCWFYVFSPGN